MDSYPNDGTLIHLAYIKKHIKVGKVLYNWAKNKDCGSSSSSISNAYVTRPIETSFSTNSS